MTRLTFSIATIAALALTASSLAPQLADACGGGAYYRANRAERARLAELRKTRADVCVMGSHGSIGEKKRNENRTAHLHYVKKSDASYDAVLYYKSYLLNRFGFTHRDLHPAKGEMSHLILRPANAEKTEWMVVRDFVAECPAMPAGKDGRI